MWRSLAATAGTQPGAWRYLAALWCAGAQNYCISHAETTPVAVLIQGLKCTLFELLWLLWKSCSWHAPQGSPPRLCHRTAPTKPVSSSPNKQNTWKMCSADRKDKYFGLISELRVGLDALESILWPKWFYDPMNCGQFTVSISLTLCPSEISIFSDEVCCHGPTEVQDSKSLHPKQHCRVRFEIKISAKKINILSPVTFIPWFPSHTRAHTTRMGGNEVLTRVCIQVDLQELFLISSVISLFHAL